MIFMGIDPSLNNCGIVVIDHNKKTLLKDTVGYTISKDKEENERIKRNLFISSEIVKAGKKFKVDVVGIEGLGIVPRNSRIGNQIFLAELSGVIKSQIYMCLKKMPVIIPPASWKKEVVGKGNLKKPEIKKYFLLEGYEGMTQDEYDALGVALFLRKKLSCKWSSEDERGFNSYC